MAALCGIRLCLDPASANALVDWLDADRMPDDREDPIIEVEILSDGDSQLPVERALIIEEPAGWLARTSTGLIVGNGERAWFAIEDSPLRIRGVLGDAGEATRDLLLGALLIALRSLGAYSIHSAVVGFEEQALMLVGDSGAGKSTTATALVHAGCRYLGDDGVLIRRHLGDIELLPFWSWFRLTDRSLASFESLRPYSAKREGDEKWRVNANAAFPNRFLSYWRGRKTLLFLTRSGEHDSFLLPLSQADALGLLIAQSHTLSLECHPDPRGHLDLLAELVGSAQIARLQLGTEWLSTPNDAACRLLARTRALVNPAEPRDEAS